jgi:hypothetical protein
VETVVGETGNLRGIDSDHLSGAIQKQASIGFAAPS